MSVKVYVHNDKYRGEFLSQKMDEEIVERGFISRRVEKFQKSRRSRNSRPRRVNIPVFVNVTDHLSKWIFQVIFK